MKIAIVVPHMIAGGLETYVFHLGRYLQTMGHTVTIVATEREGEWWGRCESLGFRTRAVLLKDSFSRITHIAKVRRELLNYDVLLLNDARYAKAALPGLPRRIAVISVVHNDSHDAYTIGSIYPDMADAVVGISPRTYNELAARVGRDKTVLILHGVEAVTSSPSLDKRALTLPVRLLYCGRAMQSDKNIFLLPKICAVLRERGLQFTLEIVGDGPDLNRLKHLFRKANLEEFVRYSGTLPHQDTYERFRNSHILLMPSFREAFPLVPLEAQALGCVPVVSRLPGVTDISVLEGKTGRLAESGDAGSFAREVLSLTNDLDGWRAMSCAGMERVRTEFSIERMGEHYCRLIEEVFAQKQSNSDLLRPSRCRWSPSLIGWTAPLPNAMCRALKIL